MFVWFKVHHLYVYIMCQSFWHDTYLFGIFCVVIIIAIFDIIPISYIHVLALLITEYELDDAYFINYDSCLAFA